MRVKGVSDSSDVLVVEAVPTPAPRQVAGGGPVQCARLGPTVDPAPARHRAPLCEGSSLLEAVHRQRCELWAAAFLTRLRLERT